MEVLGQRVKGPRTIYLTGGATALLFGWRAKTIDLDIKADPEPRGLFEAIAELKECSMSRFLQNLCRIFALNHDSLAC